MALYTEGKWHIVHDGNIPENYLITFDDNLSQTAVHMCLIYNNQNDTWKIMTFTPFWKTNPPPPPPLITFNSVLVEIFYSGIGDNPLGTFTIQEIPDWPGTNQPKPMLFCAGHNFLPDGTLIVAGGNLPPINMYGARGLKYTYKYDPVTEEWGFFGSNPNEPIQMANGRWYPTLTLLSNGKILAIDGFGSNYEPGTEIRKKMIYLRFLTQQMKIKGGFNYLMLRNGLIIIRVVFLFRMIMQAQMLKKARCFSVCLLSNLSA
ncbi:MAG TPA: hypothetical protein VJ455_09045 [Ignavibacteria bacterium]|nr:hypothetical protein [Ignavibacteria bacterium]